jgi:predicted negative regulator of RcsB-dependent stress response
MSIKEDLEETKTQLQDLKENYGVLGLYKEIIQDLKKSSKRNFVIIIILLIMLVGTNLAWLVYESQFQTIATVEEYTQETEFVDNSNINQTIN